MLLITAPFTLCCLARRKYVYSRSRFAELLKCVAHDEQSSCLINPCGHAHCAEPCSHPTQIDTRTTHPRAHCLHRFGRLQSASVYTIALRVFLTPVKLTTIIWLK